MQLFQFIKDETASSYYYSIDSPDYLMTSWSEQKPFAQSSHLQEIPHEIPELKH
jgi:hypothetical protein